MPPDVVTVKTPASAAVPKVVRSTAVVAPNVYVDAEAP